MALLDAGDGLGKTVRGLVRKFGFDLVRYPRHPDFSDFDRDLVAQVQPFTLTTPERIVALARAVEYVVERGIQGPIVECGVWKGGSMMAAALTLMKIGDQEREIYLFDTYQGMTAPTVEDVASFNGKSAADLIATSNSNQSESWWASPLEEVRANLLSTGFDAARLHFIPGMVEETIPGEAPATISLLRLDTDWYESTRHELDHLYPRLAPNGVLIIDDYGAWKGSRKATDEYFSRSAVARPLLNRIDATGRVAIKS